MTLTAPALKAALPLVRHTLAHAHTRHIADLCSGAGGPCPKLGLSSWAEYTWQVGTQCASLPGVRRGYVPGCPVASVEATGAPSSAGVRPAGIPVAA